MRVELRESREKENEGLEFASRSAIGRYFM